MTEEQREYTDPQRHVSHREHHVRTPTENLPHAEKIARQERHIRLLTLGSLLVLAALAYSAIFDLNSAAEWIVMGGIVATVAGMIIAVHSR
jgi:membrane protein YdbS with pleckstrin-like domain